MKIITVDKNDTRDLRDIFKEAGFDKRDVNMKLNRAEGTMTYWQDPPVKKSRARRKAVTA